MDSFANECAELICFCSYSTVGSYGFFRYKSGKCLRGYLSLDENGTVLFNVGAISDVEKLLNITFPSNNDEFATEGFDEINHDSLEKMLFMQ